MDRLTTILIALQTGAIIQAAATTTNENLKQSYQTLKNAIQQRFVEKRIDDMALTEYEVAPSVWRAELRRDMEEAEVEQADSIFDIASDLLARVQPEQAPAEEYDTKVRTTVQGYGEGKYQQLIMNFGRAVKEPQQRLDGGV